MNSAKEGKSKQTDIAAVDVIARHWPKKDRRHRAYLALSGGLLRAGWPSGGVETLVEALAIATEDEDGPSARMANVASGRPLSTCR